jgi:hypothetical protein
MKTILALAALTLTLATNVRAADAPEPDKNIIKVFRARHLAVLQHSKITIDHMRVTSVLIYQPEYLAAIQKIETGECPKEFQLAWFDYRKALEAHVRHPVLGKAGLDMMKKSGATTTGVGLAEAFVFGSMIEDERMKDQWDKVERAALDCGNVEIRKIKY